MRGREWHLAKVAVKHGELSKLVTCDTKLVSHSSGTVTAAVTNTRQQMSRLARCIDLAVSNTNDTNGASKDSD